MVLKFLMAFLTEEDKEWLENYKKISESQAWKKKSSSAYYIRIHDILDAKKREVSKLSSDFTRRELEEIAKLVNLKGPYESNKDVLWDLIVEKIKLSIAIKE